MSKENTYRIAAIPGDGVGPEIVPAGIKVLDAAAGQFGFGLKYEEFSYGAGYYKKTGEFMPEDALDVYPSMFEPIHGSAPDIAGRGIANPIGAIWSGAIMLEHLGEEMAAESIVRAIEKTVAQGVLPVDLGGSAKTAQITDTVVKNLG
jgi:isocitrate/isopropylmalate dehydrogenase